MKRLLLAVGALALVAAGCHGTWQVGGGIYFLTSQECADGTGQIQIFNPPYQGSAVTGTSGYFTADSQGCHPYGRSSGDVQVAADLFKQNEGLCYASPGWVSNSSGSYAAQQSYYIPYFCGGGGYYTGAHNRVLTFNSGMQTHFTTSPVDAWSG